MFDSRALDIIISLLNVVEQLVDEHIVGFWHVEVAHHLRQFV